MSESADVFLTSSSSSLFSVTWKQVRKFHAQKRLYKRACAEPPALTLRPLERCGAPNGDLNKGSLYPK